MTIFSGHMRARLERLELPTRCLEGSCKNGPPPAIDVWTRVSGGNKLDRPGVYGAKGITDRLLDLIDPAEYRAATERGIKTVNGDRGDDDEREHRSSCRPPREVQPERHSGQDTVNEVRNHRGKEAVAQHEGRADA